MLRSRRISGAKSFQKHYILTKKSFDRLFTRSNNVALADVVLVIVVVITGAIDLVYRKILDIKFECRTIILLYFYWELFFVVLFV
jgi:TRAP-type mannitol/chloroaromatic compound transport system permease small subunit